MTALNEIFGIQRRFLRSVNLERDGENPDSLEGYVLTPRTLDLTERVLRAFVEPHRTRAWTLTGVYGTGKSSFANFVSAIFAGDWSPAREVSRALLRDQQESGEIRKLSKRIPQRGLVRAVVTGRREPLAQTVVRALARGSEQFWSHRRGRNPPVVTQLLQLSKEIAEGKQVDVNVASLTREVAEASGTGVLLILDELGKILEYAAHTGGKEDLFLLQELAEQPAGENDAPILVIGLLHQAFSEYGHLLSAAEQAEWGKIQGRFEDIPFSEPADQMLRIMGRAIALSDRAAHHAIAEGVGQSWAGHLQRAVLDPYIREVLTIDRIAGVLPLHPISALVLPTLCTRYGQNERSLFTFLSSGEPNSLTRFLEENAVEDGEARGLPLLRLPTIYDYFVDVARLSSISRVQMTRWSEIHTIVGDAKGLPGDYLEVLKTIGTLNLVSSTGPLRASRELVLLALVDAPWDTADWERWAAILDDLVDQRVITYRHQIDEYRLWQGSDFDIDGAIQEQIELERQPLAQLLRKSAALPPIVAQRHSYQTGTLRYFERQYADEATPITGIESSKDGSDGVIIYWVGAQAPAKIPELTHDGLPLVLLQTAALQPLRSAALELAALLAVEHSNQALQSDAVARREIKKRIGVAREVLERALRDAFDDPEQRSTYFLGTTAFIRNFNGALSTAFDEVFQQAPVLWNEIINRRQLTSQGAKAQRELIAALLTRWDEPRLGIEGSGPDYSIYSSVLQASGIHRENDGRWEIGPPQDTEIVALRSTWDAIEEFCLSAIEEARPLNELYGLLAAPPFGVKEGIIPILLAAVLVYHDEDVSVYQEGSFLPVLSPAHFELLVKRPQLFAVKHFDLAGVKLDEYRRVLDQVGETTTDRLGGIRNETLLNVVRPLIQFAVSLPTVTKNTRDLSPEGIKVRQALLTSREPDDLMFRALPGACGYEPFVPGEAEGRVRRKEFLGSLAQAIKELRTHYERLLGECQALMHQGFGIRSDLEHMRDDLRIRAQYLRGSVIEPRLKSFVLAAANAEDSDREWLESVVMIIADRPADTWTDDDVMSFELHVSEMSRRFANLEVLQKEIAASPKEGFDVRRITLTSSNGDETRRVLWVDRDAEDQVRRKVDELLEQLQGPGSQIREAVLLQLIDRILGDSKECGAAAGELRHPTEKQSRNHA